MSRTTTGCWICRARKKKCDDGRPSCAACLMRNIECFGYGDQPDWMDGGYRQWQMLNFMERLTKESYSERQRSRAMQPARGSASSGTTAAGPEMRMSAAPPTRELESQPSQYLQQQPLLLPPPMAYNDAPPPQPPTPRPGSNSISYSDTEMSLLIYYFDHIFHRICPFFVYTAGDEGRGWLMALFLQTRPLFAAAVCISACDKAQFAQGRLSDAPIPYHDLETQHIQIVRNLRTYLDSVVRQTGASRMRAAVEALVCIIHLIYFELWIPRKGTETDWVVHMDAAAVLLSSLDTTMTTNRASLPPEDDPMRSSSMEDAMGASIEDYFPVQCLSQSEQAAFEYFLTQYTCYFVLSAVSLDITPKSAMSVDRTRAIFHHHQSRLRNVFGIEDWVMMTLLDLAVLKDWKKRQRAKGTLNIRELAHLAHGIGDRINRGLRQLRLRQPGPLLPGPFSASGTPSDPHAGTFRRPMIPPDLRQPTGEPTRDEKIDMVTATFLWSAQLLMHIVVSGFYPRMPAIQQAVLKTLEALEYMREHCDVNIYSWPLCVAGCLALEPEYPRFRALLPPTRPGQHLLVLTSWTLDIVERCWELRAAQQPDEESVSWTAAMNDLGTRLLLF